MAIIIFQPFPCRQPCLQTSTEVNKKVLLIWDLESLEAALIGSLLRRAQLLSPTGAVQKFLVKRRSTCLTYKYRSRVKLVHVARYVTCFNYVWGKLYIAMDKKAGRTWPSHSLNLCTNNLIRVITFFSFLTFLLLAPQSGALRIGAYRDFHPTHPIHL